MKPALTLPQHRHLELVPPGVASRPATRVHAIDLARGFAVTLMILSHGVKGLLDFSQIPAWGLVPIHLFTKFASSLFIIVFGVSLAVAFVPHIGTPRWKAKRTQLLARSLVVFFWYKVLTVVEMASLYTRDEIMATLLYQAFPVYVEILGFYAIALLWMPFFLPVWRKLPLAVKWESPVIVATLAAVLSKHFGFWGSDTLRALLVEHEKHYAWGQLSRTPLVLIGLLIGGLVVKGKTERLVKYVAASGALLLALFVLTSLPELGAALFALAKNEGKHPPEAGFLAFSLGGSLLLLAGALRGGERLARILRPITIIGSNALQSFAFHIIVIFVFYRYLFNYWRGISYGYALTLTLLLIGMTAVWVKLHNWVLSRSRPL